MERYKERQASEDASQLLTVGPICVTIGFVMLLVSVIFSVIFCYLGKEDPGSQYELSAAHLTFKRPISVVIFH